MEIKSIINDEKVSATSTLIEISIRDYLELSKLIYDKNNYQRRKVRGSKSIYALLKNDIIQGCVMPPIVLAYTKPVGTLAQDLVDCIKNDAVSFVLLDGLQRSITLFEIESELRTDTRYEKFLSQKIRCEIYEGINRLGILYRMLTLNTGQTAMSVRHQVEILYQDFLNIQLDDGITLIREVDGARARGVNSYNFKDVVEGFNSYLERSEYPLDRGDILDNIASLENLAKENNHTDIFKDFINTWNKFIVKINGYDIRVHQENGEADYYSYTDGTSESFIRNWGSSGLQLFKRPQAISGFGAAIGLLVDDTPGISFSILTIEAIELGSDPEDFIEKFNNLMREIENKAKK